MGRRKRGYLAREVRKAARAMRPDRVFLRFMTGGRYQTVGGLMRGVTHTGRKSIPMRPVPPGSALPTTKAAAKRARATVAQVKGGSKGAPKKTPAYEAAKAIPARNRAVAKKAGVASYAAKKPGARKGPVGRVQVPQRNPDGTFNGSVSFPTFGPAEQAAYERALRGQVDPVQQVRQPRWPK